MSKGPETPTQAPPSHEKQPADSVTLVYRDNPLFQSNVPKIVKVLESLGKKVTIKSVPVEVDDYQELRDFWNKENQVVKEEMFKGRVITDYTFSNIVSDDKDESEFDGGGLDRLMDNLAVESIMGEQLFAEYKARFAESGTDWAQAEEEKKVLQEAIKTCFERVLENPTQRPHRVVVMQSSLPDHAPFFGENGPSDDESIIAAEQAAAGTVKELLVRAGIAADDVVITTVENMFGEQFDSTALNATSEALKGPWTSFINEIPSSEKLIWVVVDRHRIKRTPNPDESITTDTTEYLGIPNVRVVFLTLPLSNLMQDVREKNLIDAPDIGARLEARIREEFSF